MIRRYPSVCMLAAVVVGIVVADRLAAPSWVWLLPALVGAGVAVRGLARGRGTLAAVSVAVTAVVLSAFHFTLRYGDSGPDDVRRVASMKETFQVYGSIDDWPDLRAYRTEIRVAVDSVRGQDTRRVRGALLVKVAEPTTALQRGDRVEFQARIYPLPPPGHGDLDYGRFLNLKGVGGIVYLPTVLGVRVDRRASLGWFSAIDGLRREITASLKATLSRPCAALAAGLLIGETRDIPASVYTMFRDTGTLHLLAVSGSNVALVLLFFLILLRPLGLSYRGRSAVLLVVIVLFAGLCYGEPSVIRASLMAALVIGARLLGRLYDLNNIIALAALTILAVDPAQLFDLGFQLSFVTAWGLVFFVPRLTPLFRPVHGRWWYRFGVFPLLIVLVAQVCSTPIIACYFDRIPLVSVPANMLVVPMVSAAVIGLLALLVAGLILPLLGLWFGSLVDLWLRWLIDLLVLFGGQHAPVVSGRVVWGGPLGVPAVVATYLLLVLGAWSLQSQRARRLAVVVLLLCLNGGLAASFLAGRRAEGAGLDIQRVPGGVAAVIQIESSESADLVVTGLQSVLYSIDDRVLEPMLKACAVERLHRVFVLNADYAALDDIVRLAQRFEADSLYVARELRGALGDVCRTESLVRMGLPAVGEFTGRPPASSADGYYASSGLLRLTVGGQHILFAGVYADESLPGGLTAESAVLVLGGAWADDQRDESARVFSTVICSRVEQGDPDEYADRELAAYRIPSGEIVDLSQVGRYHLVIRNSLSN